MERWVPFKSKSETIPEVDAFLIDLLAICEQHNMLIGYDSETDTYSVVDYDPVTADDILHAEDIRMIHWPPPSERLTPPAPPMIPRGTPPITRGDS